MILTFNLLVHLGHFLCGRMLSLRRHFEDFGLFHLHWIHSWLDTCVRNLFTGSLLDPVLRFCPTADCRYCVSSTCCVIFGTLMIFSMTCGFCTSMICSTTRSTFSFHLSVLNLHWVAVDNSNDLFHRAILYALFCYDLRNFHDFLHDSFRSPLLRNHFDSRRSALLCVVNVGLLDHFLRFSIREFLTHILYHVTLVRCKIWGCRLNLLSDRMVNFLLCDLNRTSFCQSSPCQRHCRSTLRGGSPRQTTRCSRLCQSSHVC